jgi:hypothetical protein
MGNILSAGLPAFQGQSARPHTARRGEGLGTVKSTKVALLDLHHDLRHVVE